MIISIISILCGAPTLCVFTGSTFIEKYCEISGNFINQTGMIPTFRTQFKAVNEKCEIARCAIKTSQAYLLLRKKAHFKPTLTKPKRRFAELNLSLI